METSISCEPTPSSHGKHEQDIDVVLNNMGPYGRFQVVLEISIIIAVLATSYTFMLSYFTAHDPSWKCIKNNSSEFCSLHSNETIQSNNDIFEERCKIKRDEWKYTTPRHHSLVTEFDLVCTKSSTAALATSAIYMGGILGSMVSGTSADTYGRKPVIVISLFVTICSSIGCSIVSAVWQFAAINIVLGASTVACYFTSIVYLSELVSPRYRTILCNMALVAVTVSFMIMDGVAYFEQNWRHLQRYLSILPAVAITLSIFLPESPRWLLAIGQQSKAVNVLEKIGRFNGNRGCSVNLKTIDASCERKYTYLDLCRNRKVMLLTLCLGALWVAIPTVEYSIALESSKLGGDMYQAFAFSTFADFPALIISTYVCDRFGRKKCILIGLFTSGILAGLIAIIPRSISYRYIINIVIMVSARLVNVIANFGLYIWTFELYPTVLRSQGMAVSAVFERIGLFAVPFITTLLGKVHYALPFVLICALAVVVTAIGMVLPETNKLPTRETYEDFFK